jgi:glycosyltransferase involved in cell wall biosynthesis
MRVLYLVPQPKVPGRVAKSTFMDEEIRALAAAGIDAFVLSTKVPSDTHMGSVRLMSTSARDSALNRIQASTLLVRRVEGVPVPNPAEPRNWFVAALLEHVAAKIIHEERIDVIHSHFAWPMGQGGIIASAKTGRPLVATLRGNDLVMLEAVGYGRRRRPPFDRAVRRLLKKADRTIYFSQHMHRKGLELGANPAVATVLPKGVDVARFTPCGDRVALRQELGFGPRPMILTVGGLIRIKGVDHVLKALARLRGELDFSLAIVGEGPERETLKELSAQLGLTEQTVFTGRLDRATIPKYFAACDVFIHASLTEAAGNVVLEAMSAGRPVVCTDSGGPGEFVRDGQTGFVVPVADVEAIAARVKFLLQNATVCDQLGAAGRRRAVAEYSYDRMTGDIIDVYQDLLKRCSPERAAVSR